MVKCDLFNLLTLNTNTIKNWTDTLIFVTPFANEIANLLSITLFKPYLGVTLYPHHPETFNKELLKTLIDIIAIGGIIYISIIESHKSNYITNGLVYGLLYLIFAFSIPNLFMSKILNIFDNKDSENTLSNNLKKLAAGIFFIYILELCINLIMCSYKNSYNKKIKDEYKEKDIEEEKEEEDEKKKNKLLYQNEYK